MIGRSMYAMFIIHLVIIFFAIGLGLLILSIPFPKIRNFASMFLAEIPSSLMSDSNRKYKRR
ncbi:hypothetical protein CRU98_13290 [Arcobacter sp. CECT 8986]|uniref:hypothetical protein n=1 Tax=Arcobacter sp. CECT 8986 TaxID=2044507 RepID=UPI001009C7E7|nr:hypothetical protein [Arcobacter sp. CECT 8986]RXJ97602.1 hypothetical protein CRU98_13290 [Arcobacter sp. CECT 8986]